MTITKRMILMKNKKLLSVFQLLRMLHGTNIYMNNILVMLNILQYSCASNEHWFWYCNFSFSVLFLWEDVKNIHA